MLGTSEFGGHNPHGWNRVMVRAAMAGKAGKVWSMPRFWVSIHSYKKQSVKKFWDRILDLAWLKFSFKVAGIIGGDQSQCPQ